MTDCVKIKEQIVAYLDDELGPQEKAECQSHLAICLLCQKEKEALARTWQLLEAVPSLELSPMLAARFWERVRQEEETRSWFSLPRLVPAMAGFVAIWVIGVSLGSGAFMRTASFAHDRGHSVAQWVEPSHVFSLGTAYLRRVEEK